MTSNADETAALICQAIQRRSLLEFKYKGLVRVVAPYCLGTSPRGGDLLRAVQVRGESSSGKLASGKLWTVSDMSAVRLLSEPFTPNDPNYNPNDRAMTAIRCRV